MAFNASNSSSSSYYFPCSIPVSDKEIRSIWSFLFVFFGFVIAAVNFVTVLTFAINRQLRRRSILCLINLAVVDMLHGLLYSAYESLVLVVFWGRVDVEVDKKLWGFFLIPVNHMSVLSIMSLVLVSLDRFYATFFPFRHRTTRLRFYIAVFAVTWLLPLPLVITENSASGTLEIDCLYYFIVIMLYIVCLLIICTSYTAIFVLVKIHARRLQPSQQQAAAIKTKQKREQQLAMTLFIVTSLSVMTWLPFIIAYSTGLLQKKLNETFIPFEVALPILLMQFINSLINPIILVIREKSFRNTLLQLLCRCSSVQHHIGPVGNHGNNGIEQQPAMELPPLQNCRNR